MIVRKYNRRNRGLSRSCSDSTFDEAIVSDEYEDSLSQESPQDIYSFAFSSQDSSSHWSFDSEPYVSNSSQGSRQLAILPPRKPLIGGDIENGDEAFWMSKKPRNSLDFDPYGLNSSQESRKLEVLPSKKVTNVDLENLDNGNECYRKEKKVKNANKKELKSKRMVSFSVPLEQTKTLLETQEFGEMMEHDDEVYFALDGLRKGQPARIRRASLLSLLSICGTAQQRRLLRTNGTAKTILDSVVGLSFDDPPSNLAAAALFYILTSDGQDEHLVDSPSCIRFLMKMLKPLPSRNSNDKAPTIGCKLLALRKDASYLQYINGADSTSSAILHKVLEILVSCKQMKSSDGKDNGREKPELSPKWISLLTMEKACLSSISFEETSGNVRKMGGNFKENFREHGGLDVVFDVARTCHSNMERWLEELSSQIVESKDDVNLESLVMLLKCLKIMENATFLSQDNQSHLLKMKSKFNSQHQPQSFTKLMLSIIKILSGVSLLISSSGSSGDEKLCSSSNETYQSCHATERPVMVDNKEGSNEILSISSSMECCSMQWTPSQKSSNISHNSQRLASNQLGVFKSPSPVTTTTCPADTSLLKIGASSSTPSSCNGTLSGPNGETLISNSSWTKFGIGKTNKISEDTKFELTEDSQDPFAFHEDEFEPSKWDLLSGRQKVSQSRKKRSAAGVHENGCQSLLTLGQQEEPSGILGQQQEPSSMESQNSSELSCPSSVDAEKSNLLSDCLLTAVKVLMNLTNDNSVGCQQIAASGGLEILSSLIAGHFPSFSSYLPPFIELKKHGLTSKSGLEIDHQNDRHLTDEELDFLVAILGLLVNLVEKDGRNRSRLAATSISFPSSKGSEDESRDVIPLLCSIFLANQGAGEAAEGRNLPSDDEDALLQGEKEAEKMIVEAYSALLLAFLSTESNSIRNAIAECLPDHNLAILVPVLERFVEFHLTLNMISPETHKTVLEVIESCRMP